MRLIKPSYKVVGLTDVRVIEQAGRTCYKSEHKTHDESYIPFIKNIIKSGHESVLEHSSMSVRFIVDRGVTHELVRHRLVAYSQESTRYCSYTDEVTFIIPPWVLILPGVYKGITDTVNNKDNLWMTMMLLVENYYTALIHSGWSPQQARSVLPNSLKTEIVATANFREWRHIFKLRALGKAGKPHPQMLEVMIPLLEEVKTLVPVVFEDLVLEA